VGTNLGTFLDQADLEIAAGFARQLLQAARGRKSARPAADDNDVKLHGFAF
jgi:hypothetical protein